MSSRCVGLITRDPRLYAELAPILREAHLPVVSLMPGERIPPRVAVVLTSDAEAGHVLHPRVLRVPEGVSRASLLTAVNAGLRLNGNHSELIVGFDPGPRPGFAVVAQDQCLARGTLDAPEEVGRLGEQLQCLLPEHSIRFRVGSGAPLHRDRILRALAGLGLPVEVVDERGTTPPGGRRPSDALAALAIAETRGRPMRSPPELVLTDGEIANVQRLSREGSGGQFTISRAQAGRVLRGEITFHEAIDEQARQHVPRRTRADPAFPGR